MDGVHLLKTFSLALGKNYNRNLLSFAGKKFLALPPLHSLPKVICILLVWKPGHRCPWILGVLWEEGVLSVLLCMDFICSRAWHRGVVCE